MRQLRFPEVPMGEWERRQTSPGIGKAAQASRVCRCPRCLSASHTPTPSALHPRWPCWVTPFPSTHNPSLWQQITPLRTYRQQQLLHPLPLQPRDSPEGQALASTVPSLLQLVFFLRLRFTFYSHFLVFIYLEYGCFARIAVRRVYALPEEARRGR